MSHAPVLLEEEVAKPKRHTAPVSPGKVAMWLFLSTEIMFFTGLIGSYVVLRLGSPPLAFSRLYAPNTDMTTIQKLDLKAVVIDKTEPNREKLGEGAQTKYDEEAVAKIVARENGVGLKEAKHMLDWGTLVVKNALSDASANKLAAELEAAGVTVSVRGIKGNSFSWPLPYDRLTNPLSIDLTAVNTFILICSSVTMVLALAAIQRNERGRSFGFLLATVVLGSIFLSIQVIEYSKLFRLEHYPVGISATGHWTPSASLFASCFYVMTGFHGAHVAGGVILLACITIQTARGVFHKDHHSAMELAGLYWHFVDLVWILLFTVVYLV